MVYFIFFIISFLLSIAAVYLARGLGGKFGFFDIAEKDILKIHKKPTSFLGGLVILLVFSIVVLFFLYLKGFLSWEIGAIIFAGFLLFLIGFWDDLRWKKKGVSTIKKFLFLISFSLLATIVLIWQGIEFQIFPIIWLNSFLLFFLIFGLINAVNFEDGIDGLAGGLVAISLLGFIFLGVLSGNGFALAISVVLLGAIFGFLVFNFPPASMFMGDSGAYFLGFILVVLLTISSKIADIKSVFVPLFFIALPIFDTGFAIIRRTIRKKSPFKGDRGHFFDRMITKGFSVRETDLIFYLLQLIMVLVGILIYKMNNFY